MKIKTLAMLVGSAVFAVSCTTAKNYIVYPKSGSNTQGTADFVPVSYTHLDVYKRQNYNSIDFRDLLL